MTVVKMPGQAFRVVNDDRHTNETVIDLRPAIQAMADNATANIRHAGQLAEAQREADQTVSRMAAELHALVDRMIAAAPHLDASGARNTDQRMILMLQSAVNRVRDVL